MDVVGHRDLMALEQPLELLHTGVVDLLLAHRLLPPRATLGPRLGRRVRLRELGLERLALLVRVRVRVRVRVMVKVRVRVRVRVGVRVSVSVRVRG